MSGFGVHFMVILMNWSIIRVKAIDQQKQFKDTTMETCKRVEVVEAKSKHLKEALAKMEANLVSNKKNTEAKTAKAKEELADAEKAMETFRASTDFTAKKLRAVIAFRMLKEFYETTFSSARKPSMSASNWARMITASWSWPSTWS